MKWEISKLDLKPVYGGEVWVLDDYIPRWLRWLVGHYSSAVTVPDIPGRWSICHQKQRRGKVVWEEETIHLVSRRGDTVVISRVDNGNFDLIDVSLIMNICWRWSVPCVPEFEWTLGPNSGDMAVFDFAAWQPDWDIIDDQSLLFQLAD